MFIDKILQPDIAPQHKIADDHFNNFRKADHEKDAGDGEGGVMCQYIGKRNYKYPGVDAVKQKGNDGFAA